VKTERPGRGGAGRSELGETWPGAAPRGRFLASDDALGAWVAEDDGRILGQVALHRRSARAVMDLATSTLGLPAERLGVVARLVVRPGDRRLGVGRGLLEKATDEATDRGLWPVLDVLSSATAAIALYEGCGWTRAGEVTVTLGSGEVSFEEAVFLAPPRAGAPRPSVRDGGRHP
jgi:ribosomal protein S18 acetylase RimI-like enzyme